MSWYKLYTSFLIGVLFADAACAVHLGAASFGERWGVQSNGTGDPLEDFVLDGGIGKSNYGTHGDEGAVTAVFATKVTEGGVLMCPYQFQCHNERRERTTWTEYHKPSAGDKTQLECEWFCEAGYYGAECSVTDASTRPARCDNTIYTKESRYSAIRQRRSGGSVTNYEGAIAAFASAYTGFDEEVDVVLGVVRFLEHGVVLAPIHVECGRDNWDDIDSYVKQIVVVGSKRLLCAEGYTPDSSGQNCIPIDADVCETSDLIMCSNFDKTMYSGARHKLQTGNGCAKYFCRQEGTAFAARGDTNCVDCAGGTVKGGTSPDDGTCVVCKSGQYFNSQTAMCEMSGAMTKTDIQYGYAKTKNTARWPVSSQCWTKVTPAEYVACIQNTVLTAGGGASETSDYTLVLSNLKKPNDVTVAGFWVNGGASTVGGTSGGLGGSTGVASSGGAASTAGLGTSFAGGTTGTSSGGAAAGTGSAGSSGANYAQTASGSYYNNPNTKAHEPVGGPVSFQTAGSLGGPAVVSPGKTF